MTETFNVFDEPRDSPMNHLPHWLGRDICTIQEPHQAHNWTIDYVPHGEVEYYCPGVGAQANVWIDPNKEDISDD